MRAIAKFLFRLFAVIVYRPKVIGKENLPKESGAILCPNHVHPLDAPIIIAMLKNRINVLAKEELFKSGFFRWLAGMFDIHPIKRGKADMQAIKTSLVILKNNKLLLMFPEGTRKGLEKGIKPKSGAVLIAATAQKPIIPIGIKGNFKPFRRVIITIGKPIEYSKYKGEVKDKETANKLTKELMDEIIKLRDN